MFAMGRTMALAAVFLTLSAHSETVYQNDFASRLSLKPVPAIGKWVRYDYTPGRKLTYWYGKSNLQYSESLPWADPAQMQDGWIHGAYGTWHPGSYVTNNVDSDTSRPFAAFDLNNDATYYKGLLYQPIDNSFSNGTLTCWIDMRVPTSWGITGAADPPQLRFFPAYRTFLENPDGLSNAFTFPAICGIQGTSAVRFYGFATTSTGAASLSGAFYNKGTVAAGKWVRFRMEMNFDTKRTSCSVWTLGTTVPDWNTAVTDDGLHETDRYLYRFPTAERGPVEGIGLYVAGVKSKGDVRKMPAFTNIRLEWQAPGSAIAQSCYSNNFVTCWKRRLTTGTTAHAYDAASPHMVTNFYAPEIRSGSHMAFHNTADPYLTPAPSTTRTVGLDGWKRCDNNGGAVYAVGTTQLANTNFLKMCARTNGTEMVGFQYAAVSQTLGEKITSGKVRLSVDGRTPDKWYWGTRGLFVALGSDYLYSGASTGDYSSYYAARIGVTSPGNTTKPHPKCYGSDGATDIDTTNVTFRTWQRYVITADLDHKTYDWAIYDIGGGVADRPNPETPVASGTGVSFEHDVSDVASFVLLGYGFVSTSTFNGQILFDNIQVWKNWDDAAQTGDLIYYNDFEERRRIMTVDERRLTGKSNVFRPDCDGWARRGDCSGRLVIAGDTNPFVSGSGDGENLAFHDLGTRWAASATRQMTLRVDMRPPDFWYGTGRRRALVAIGGGSAAQGDAFGEADPLAKSAIRFGFVPSGETKDTCGRYTTIAACAGNGAADETASFTVDKTAWYRFVVTTRPANGTYDLDVYRQGTHPAVSDANGTLVASYRGLAYGSGSDGELSAVGIDASGVRGFSPWDAEDPGCALFDNIVVDRQPYGTTFSIR